MIDTFLRGLGFSPSSMDPCLYKRENAIIILFCDDLRVAGRPETVLEIKTALFTEFQITTSDGTRFLGMDTYYDIKQGCAPRFVLRCTTKYRCSTRCF
jgi:hypothetical protein